jgi:hypothetical protein
MTVKQAADLTTIDANEDKAAPNVAICVPLHMNDGRHRNWAFYSNRLAEDPQGFLRAKEVNPSV